MMKTLAFRVVLGSVLAWSATAGPLLVSDFESGTTDGWDIIATGPQTTPPGAADALANASPGGVGNSRYVFTEDRADGQAYFRAPASWAGDYFGDPISFYLKNFNPSNPYATLSLQSILFIQGSGGPNLYLRGTLPTLSYPPGDGWTLYSLVLDTAQTWSLNEFSLVAPTATQIQNTLSSITRIHILADYASGHFGKPTTAVAFGHDIGGLDNVSLGTNQNVIPEPGTMLLTFGGLAAAFLIRRRAA